MKMCKSYFVLGFTELRSRKLSIVSDSQRSSNPLNKTTFPSSKHVINRSIFSKMLPKVLDSLHPVEYPSPHL
jgi:hypothetical protein